MIFYVRVPAPFCAPVFLHCLRNIVGNLQIYLTALCVADIYVRHSPYPPQDDLVAIGGRKAVLYSKNPMAFVTPSGFSIFFFYIYDGAQKHAVRE